MLGVGHATAHGTDIAYTWRYFFSMMVQNALLNIVIIPLKSVILSALRAHTVTARVQKMCEEKIALDGAPRADAARCASLVDLRAAALAAAALRRVALQHERFTDWRLAGDDARERAARAAHVAEKDADMLERAHPRARRVRPREPRRARLGGRARAATARVRSRLGAPFTSSGANSSFFASPPSDVRGWIRL